MPGLQSKQTTCYSVREYWCCSVMKHKALGRKHGVVTDIQESRKAA